VPLVDIELSINGSDLPSDVRAFLREAYLRVGQFVRNSPIRVSGFAPSGFATVYRSLRAIVEAKLAPGNLFCEWGSGFGVAASLAAILKFRAYGIEIETGLVNASKQLAGDFGLPVEFVHGSFIPPGGGAYADETYANDNAEFFELVTDADNAYSELGLDPDNFDVFFAYPWPDEEQVIENLFARYAAEGALLLTYNQFHSVRLRRKVGVAWRKDDQVPA
jgi:hypothetical protein